MIHPDLEVLDTPVQSLLMGVKEDVEAVAAYCPAPVEDLNRVAAVVARDEHLGPEGISAVRSHEGVAAANLVAVSRLTI